MCDTDTSEQFALGYIPSEVEQGTTTTTTTTRTSWFVRGRMDGWGWHVCCWEGFALRLRLSQVYFRHSRWPGPLRMDEPTRKKKG